MSATEKATVCEGPSDRAVAIARVLLVIFGCGWLVVGATFAFGGTTSEMFLGLIICAAGIAHFAVARYASRRVAVFVALFGP